MDQAQPVSVKDASASLECLLLKMDSTGARTVLDEALALSPPETVLEEVVVPALERIGQAWEDGRIALSQVYMSGRISEVLVESLLPQADAYRDPHPRMAIAVLEDHHMLGKRIVSSMINASGFRLLDFGAVDADALIEKALDEEIDILLISTLLLPSALKIEYVAQKLQKAGWTGKTLVGGAPFRFDTYLWEEVGADATSATAAGAVRLVKEYSEAMP